MKKEDRKRFGLAINKTRVMLPGPALDDQEKALRTEGFWEQLEDYSIEVVEEAFQWARRELKFFPTPKELTDHISEERERRFFISQSEQRKELAWSEPTPEGRELARRLYQGLMNKWDEEDLEKAEKRQEEFERKRAVLLKQRELLKRG